MSPSTSTISTTSAPTFKSLGVKTLINCYGTYTIITGSRALKQVAEAMYEATNNYVHMDELMDKVGQRLSELTGAEWGYVSSGAAAGLAELTAACIVGADPEKMARLPDTTGMKNEVIVQKGHRNSYDRAVTLVGARMVEVVTAADLKAAISEHTAMVLMVGDVQRPGNIPPEVVIRTAHEAGLPCVVDAAAQRPDVPNRYLSMGADAVCYSGGKCLRGPQGSGLVLGQKALLQAAFLNAAPHHGVARPMKAGKEEIMGLLAAVEAWVRGRDHQAEWRMWEGFLETFRAAVADIPSVTTEVRQPGISNVAPMLVINWDQAKLGWTPAQVHKEMREGNPPVAIHLLPAAVMINPYMMELGDDRIAAARLREVLSNPRQAAGAGAAVPVSRLAGTWQVEIAYIRGKSAHSMTLQQDQGTLSGTYRFQYSWGEIQGKVVGDQVELHTTMAYPGNSCNYVFTGAAKGDVLSGTVQLGEYWSAQWTAKRVGDA